MGKKVLCVFSILIVVLSVTFISAQNESIIDNDAVMGNPNAPVTVVEFGGLEEDFSDLFWSNTFPQIKSEYIDTGKVKFVFRDFPLEELFPYDFYAAVAAECVHIQGGNEDYFEMLDALYTSNEPFSEELIDQIAFNIGHNISICLEQDPAIEEVIGDVIDAYQLGVEGSPSFFINEELISGAQNFSVFQTVIEQALNESVACFSSAQCNDSQPYTFDSCLNSGLLNASCTHQPIQCLKNSDCGNVSTINFCSNDDLCNRTTSYLCLSPGTVQASCSSSVVDICGDCSFGCNNQSLMCKPSPIMNIYSPAPKIYNFTSIVFNITTGSDSFGEITFIDWNEESPSWNLLCKNCNEYGFKKKLTKSFSEGLHNLTFKAINGTGVITKNISYFIDSRDPRISKILPRSKAFSNGSDFYLKYSEDNCNYLILGIYGNFSNKTTPMSCSSGTNIDKFISNNLSLFNNQEIEYQFKIHDVANNSKESRKTKIRVDVIKPKVNSFVNITNGRRVTFTLNVTELNFEEVNYIDYNDLNPNQRILCSSLKNGICNTTKSFDAGSHNLTILILDEAGNGARLNTKFNLV